MLKIQEVISAKPRDAEATAPLTVAWQHSVIFYSFILSLIHLHLSPGLTQGSLQREFSIFSHWGYLFTTDFLETTEFCQEEHRTQGLSKDRFWNGLFAPSSLSFASHCAFCQDVSQQVPLVIATPFVSIQPATQCMPRRHGLHRFCELKIPVNGKLLQH